MSKRTSKEDIIKFLNEIGMHFADENCEYKNNRIKFEVECEHGHRYETTLTSLKKTKQCKFCGWKEFGEKRKLDYNYVKEYIESFGYKLLETEYIKSDVPMKMMCDRGHICYICWDNFKYGKRCKECTKEDLSKKFRNNYNTVKEYIESFGFKLLSKEYVNNSTPLLIECPEGHKFYRCYANFRYTQNCPICGKTKGEKEVSDILDKLHINYIYNTPYFDDLLSPKGNPLKPDFIIEDKRVWIEYDGEFHYNQMYEGDGHEDMVIHDKLKNEYAKDNNWKLIRIPYWEFDSIETILRKELNN